jgi:hypothetical protein
VHTIPVGLKITTTYSNVTLSSRHESPHFTFQPGQYFSSRYTIFTEFKFLFHNSAFKTAASSKNIRRVGKVGNRLNTAMEFYNNVAGRDLGGDDGLFERDFDMEELLEREYDLFDERDTFDDLD